MGRCGKRKSNCQLLVVNCQLKSFFLLAICLLMQVAEVFPHHHHSDYFCLHPDLEVCAEGTSCADRMHHEGDGDRHTCTAGCITHFQCATPDQHRDTLAPDYTFYSILYTFMYLLHLVYMPEATLLSDGMYIENLHTQDVACNTGLRAPPVC